MRSDRERKLPGLLVTPGRRTILLRAAILSAGWWALNEGELAGTAFGIFTVLASLVVSLALASAGTRWQPRGFARLAIWFLIWSIRGGLDVAYRALARGLPISPGMVRYAVKLPGASSRELFAGALSLMPGTLSVALVDRVLEVHVLVADPGVRPLLERVERAVAQATGERLEARDA